MDKKVAIRLTLVEGPEVHAGTAGKERAGSGTVEHTVLVRRGWSVVARVNESGDGFDISDPYQGNIFTRHREELASRDRRIKELEAELARVRRGEADAEARGDLCVAALDDAKSKALQFVEWVDSFKAGMGIAVPDVRSADVAHPAGFSGHCRMGRIVGDLKNFIDLHSHCGSGGLPRWEKRYWPIVCQLFGDLQWWAGNHVAFRVWVCSIGYDLKKGIFDKGWKAVKDRGKAWYARPEAASGDDYDRMGHALYRHFTDGLFKPTLGMKAYDGGQIGHGELVAAIRAVDPAATRMQLRARVLALIDSAGLAPSVADICMVRLSAFVPRHVNMGTIGIIDNTKPGRRRRAPASTGLRKRRGAGLLMVPRHP